MARRTVYVSDLSGKDLDEKDSVRITVTFSDARRGVYVLDADPADSVVKDLIAKGRKQQRRGRRSKAAATAD
jgi:hypothetical protein